MSVAGMVTAAAQALSEQDVIFHKDSDIRGHLATGELLIALFRGLTEKTADFTLSSHVGLYLVHAQLPDFILPKHISYKGTQLMQTTLAAVSRADPLWLKRYKPPKRFFTVGATMLGFTPVPPGPLTVQVTYVAAPPSLIIATDTTIGSEWQESLVDFATAILLAKESEITQAQRWMDSFAQKVGLEDWRFSPAQSRGPSRKVQLEPQQEQAG